MDNNEFESIKIAVYDVVHTIPKGRATSYGAIARAIGYSTHSRLVGYIMSRCDSVKNKIPAHRVVNSQGVLSGKAAFGREDEMKKLLESEGLTIENNKIKKWKKVFWDPLEEINI